MTTTTTTTVVFRNARVFDGHSPELREDCDVVVEGGVVRTISPSRNAAFADAEIVECGGRVLMPGMIDAHVHVYAADVNLPRVTHLPRTYTAHYASQLLSDCLDHGFTTIRDVGGGDVGLANALRDGLVRGPRLFYGGRIISQTGGHGDMRAGDADLDDHVTHGCACHDDIFSVIADGPDAVRAAAREELRRGASHIKLMASGGMASPTDPLEFSQYSDDEIRAAVDEATRVGKYVAAHCHPDESIRRCVALGVRSIEHASMITDDTARFVAEHGAFTVPTMVIIFSLLEKDSRDRLPKASVDKLVSLSKHMLAGLETMHRNGVDIGFGTDLLGHLRKDQPLEFEIRSRVLPALDILRSACSVNARLLGQEGRIGCVAEGALADLLVVDGNPLDDIRLLSRPRETLSVVMARGEFVRRSI
ncbi:amidohydrolase family protein [Streptomyces sp. NPDC094472]|uniref:metal-dependent hydrolase family protein n=1 Tax=Streptomyces sp. NPDC094472 TaxID=3155080 RepID=UPI003329982E